MGIDGRVRVVRVMALVGDEGYCSIVPCRRTQLKTFKMERHLSQELHVSDLQVGPFGCAAGRPPAYVWEHLKNRFPKLSPCGQVAPELHASCAAPMSPELHASCAAPMSPEPLTSCAAPMSPLGIVGPCSRIERRRSFGAAP